MSAGPVAGIDVGGSGFRGRAVRDGRVVAELSLPGPVRISGASLAPVIGELARALVADPISVASILLSIFDVLIRKDMA